MNAVFRCDATAGIGFGHLSRCIALAEALRLSAVHSSFAGQFDSAAVDQVEAAGFICEPLPEPVNSERETEPSAIHRADFMIVDSYRADAHYLQKLGEFGPAIVAIDDFAQLESYPCRAVLNFTWGARQLGYEPVPALLLGPEYFPARRRLVELRGRSLTRRRQGPVRNLLIAIGGSDPKRIGDRLVGLLRGAHRSLCLRVIAASEADPSGPMADFAPGSAVLPRQPDLSQQLLWADACITGGGLIKYESAFMGVPAAAISQNAGQAEETRTLARAGLVFDLGLADDLDDGELTGAMSIFLANDDLRAGLAARVAGTFPPDPSAHAARAILNAVGR